MSLKLSSISSVRDSKTPLDQLIREEGEPKKGSSIATLSNIPHGDNINNRMMRHHSNGILGSQASQQNSLSFLKRKSENSQKNPQTKSTGNGLSAINEANNSAPTISVDSNDRANHSKQPKADLIVLFPSLMDKNHQGSSTRHDSAPKILPSPLIRKFSAPLNGGFDTSSQNDKNLSLSIQLAEEYPRPKTKLNSDKERIDTYTQDKQAVEGLDKWNNEYRQSLCKISKQSLKQAKITL